MIYLGYALIGLSALVAFGNLVGCIGALRRRRRGEDRGYSNVPLLSVLFAFGGWALGGEAIGLWAFIPAAVDPGTLVVAAIPVYALFGRDGTDGQDSSTK